MDACNTLDKLAKLKKINDHNSKNLLKFGINMEALPRNLDTTIKEFVDIQNITGLDDLNPANLELWHLSKKLEMQNLQQDLLKPLQRKVRNITKETEKEVKKIEQLVDSIDDFQRELISDKECQSKTNEFELLIAEAEKAILETPVPQLDCDDLIDKVNILSEEKKSKVKYNLKK